MADHFYRKGLEKTLAFAEDQRAIALNVQRRAKTKVEEAKADGYAEAYGTIISMVTPMLERDPKQAKMPTEGGE